MKLGRAFPSTPSFPDALRRLWQEVSTILDGGLGFGDGVGSDNLTGAWVTYTTNGTPDTEDAIAHNLGHVPIGVLAMVPPAAGYLYKGTTTWTTTHIYMKCSAAAQAVTLFIVLPSHGA